jgi:prepilin-type N-terminal cleavage/methylation domain-containing protein
MQHDHAETGFTLIEILLVVAIIAIMTALVMANLNDARKKARDTARKADLGNIAKALESYKILNGDYPTTAGWVYGKSCQWISGLSSYFPNCMPVDPLNTGSTPWGSPGANNGGYVYAYFYRPSIYPNAKSYDLVAKLEVATDAYRCENQCYEFFYPSTGVKWCAGIGAKCGTSSNYDRLMYTPFGSTPPSSGGGGREYGAP